MSLRKRVKETENYVIKKSLNDLETFKLLFEEVSELMDRVEALEKGKPCECKKENEDGIKDNDRR